MRLKTRVKPNVEGEKLRYAELGGWAGQGRKPSNFPVLLLLPHTAWGLHIGTRGHGSSYT